MEDADGGLALHRPAARLARVGHGRQRGRIEAGVVDEDVEGAVPTILARVRRVADVARWVAHLADGLPVVVIRLFEALQRVGGADTWVAVGVRPPRGVEYQ